MGIKDNEILTDIIEVLAGLEDRSLSRAEQTCRIRVGATPQDPVVLNNLGLIYLATGRIKEAVRLFELATGANPNSAKLHFNHGRALFADKELNAAKAAFQRAIQFDFDLIGAHCELGHVLHDQENYQESYIVFLGANQRDSNRYEPHAGLGTVLHSVFQFDNAIKVFRDAIALAPTVADLYVKLGGVLKDQGDIRGAISAYENALRLNSAELNAFSRMLYCISFSQYLPPQEIRALAERFGHLASANSSNEIKFEPAVFSGDRKLRVAFVSAEIGQHAVAYFLESYLKHYDRTKVHLTLYSTAKRTEARHKDLCALTDASYDISDISDDAACTLIRQGANDVLIHTSGHMRKNSLKLLARRCAAVQCEYIGYHGTTGIEAMDYFIGDENLTPLEHEDHFSEKVWRLPRLWYAYSAPSVLPVVRQRALEAGVVFGALTNLTKASEQCLDIWATILHAVPDATLLLKDAFALDSYSARRVRFILTKKGIHPDRVLYRERTSDWHNHMETYNEIDIVLDTVPLTNGTTGFDALVMSTPMITIQGNWIGGRNSSTVLKALGREEWIASNVADYVKIAQNLTDDKAELRSHKLTLRDEVLKSPLCDGAEMARTLDAAFHEMAERYRSNRIAVREGVPSV